MKMALMGDVMLGRLVNERLKGEEASYVWGDTLEVLKGADTRVCNLECVISDKGEPWDLTPKTFHFRSDAKNVEVLKVGGIDVVGLANNHVLDYGYEAMGEMFEILEGSGVGYAGAGENLEMARRAVKWEVKGVRIGMLALTDNEPFWEATEDSGGVYYVPISLEDRRYGGLVELIKKTKGEVDLLIVSAHWGGNWGYRPDEGHEEFGHAMIEEGVDVVFGHSCHVFRGIEMYKGKPIIYGAGDFIDDYAVDAIERNDESFIFMIEVEGKEIKGLQMYPTVIGEFRSRRAGGKRGKEIMQKMGALCGEYTSNVRLNEEEGCLEVVVV